MVRNTWNVIATQASHFNSTVWLMLLGSFMMRGSYFMAWPFLIFLLHDNYYVDVLEVGSILACSALLGAILGLYTGYLSDKVGRKVILLCGTLFATLSFIGIAIANEVWQFFLSILLCGVAQPLINTPSRAIISDQLRDQKIKEFALSLNYFFINIGAAIGPFVGTTISLTHPTVLFLITAGIYLFYGLLCIITLKHSVLASALSREPINFLETMKIVCRDKAFVVVMVVNFLVMFVFAHLESSLIQIISLSGAEQRHQMIVNIYLINTLTILCLQFPLSTWLKHLSLSTRMKIGIALMGGAQIAFILSPVNSLFAWGVAIFIISVGEAIVFPLMNIQVDRMAPEHLRGVYYGATSLYIFGFALAPIVGGFILKFWSAEVLFLCCCAICLLAITLYAYSDTEQTVNLQPIN